MTQSAPSAARLKSSAHIDPIGELSHRTGFRLATRDGLEKKLALEAAESQAKTNQTKQNSIRKLWLFLPRNCIDHIGFSNAPHGERHHCQLVAEKEQRQVGGESSYWRPIGIHREQPVCRASLN